MQQHFNSNNFSEITENMVRDNFERWHDILYNRRISPQLLQSISKFNADTLKEVRLGIEHGLSEEQIRVYAESNLYYAHMEQIRLGFEEGLTFEQVQLYSQRIHLNEMRQIRLGIKNGLTQKQLECLINADVSRMLSIRQRFEFENAVNSIKPLIEQYPKE